jgi:nitrite transporter NirC
MKTESGKLIIMFCVIATFVIAGFEHCVANMATFSLAYLILDQAPPIGLVLHNMLFVTIGNMLGGALFLGLPVTILAKKDKNWHLADKIRNEIISQGYKIKDTKDSYIIERD